MVLSVYRMPICQEPGWTTLGILVVFVYVALSVYTARKAEQAGRGKTVWLFYAGVAPVVSLVHLYLAERRKKRRAPAAN